MKSHFGFLSFCLLLTVLLLSSPLRAAFKIDVHINDAENSTLTFGEDETAKESPFPPFSGMFGVVDVCFAGAEDAPEWFDRLADDIRVANDANTWTLVAKSNARVTWKKKSGVIPGNLKIVWNDIKSGEFKEAEISANTTLSLKAGTTYAIKRNAVAGDIPENPDPNTGYAKKVDGEMQSVDFTLDAAEGDEIILRLNMNAGNNTIRYDGEEGKEDASWEVTFTAPGYTVAYAWEGNNILVVTLTRNGTRGAGDDWGLSLIPLASSAAPMEVSDADGEGATYDIEKVLHAILLKFGTLDFDGDGVITADDVMYLYNFVQNGCDPDTSIEDIKDFTSANSSDEKRTIALEYLKNSTDDLKFSGDSEITSDDVMFMYNFVQNGCDPDTSAEDIADFNSGLATPAKREAALISLKECVE